MLAVFALMPGCMAVEADPFATWQTYGGDPGSTRYSSLEQITVDNVTQLEVAWIFHTGDARADNRSQIQANPIVIDTILYATSPQLKVFALHAATGERLWAFDPFAQQNADPYGVNRGVTYWESRNDHRILFTAGDRLFAVDALTGEPIRSFGDNGSVSLKHGLDRDVSNLYVVSNTPGVIFENVLILGTRVSEGPQLAAPGHVRAYDVRDGSIVWTFRTIPRPGEYGYETWPSDAWTQVGGANAWAGMSVDRDRGAVYVPTGSAAFDFWGGDRAGENLFANTLLALDARTGERLWHYQVVRHDLWDRDLPAPPNLVTLERDGVPVDAVAQITKSGHVFVFERETGEPLFPIEEIRVPASDLRGEEAWGTQPVPVLPPPFARQRLTQGDLTDISPKASAEARARFSGVRSGGQFVPPSTDGTVIFPGFDGGGEWGGAAVDPFGVMYVNASEMPWILTMVDLDVRRSSGEREYAINCASCHGPDLEGDPQQSIPALIDLADRGDVHGIIRNGRGVMPSFAHLANEQREAIVSYLFDGLSGDRATGPSSTNSLYGHTGYNRFLDSDGYPAVKPPWGTLTAIDLNAGTIRWQVPLGEFPELTARGIPPTGTENYGGPLVTAGGVLLIGASQDEYFRAFDLRTGEELWKAKLPAGGYATPSTYMVDGRQYVVIAAGGGKMGTPSGDAYVTFALPTGSDH